MPPRVVSFTELESLAGQDIGVSGWHLVTQDEINLFAQATHDHQWIHVDPERARSEAPFGGPIAHGYYTLSLAPYLLEQIWAIDGVRMGINYGLNKLRFPAPLLIGKRVRAHAKLAGIEKIEGGAQVAVQITFEIEDVKKPACVAEALYRYYM